MPALNKFDSVCIIADDDPNFSSPVWIDHLIDEMKGYSYKTLSKKSKSGEKIATGVAHELELKFLDPSGMPTLRTWEASGKRVWVFAFGLGGCMFWMDSSMFVIDETPDSGDGKPAIYTLAMAENGWLNIRSGVNLLFPTLSKGEATSWFSAVTNGTLSSTTKNGSFVAGNNPVYKMVQAAAGVTAVHTGSGTGNFKFPVKTGMKFSLFGNSYLYNQTSSFNRKIGLKVFDGSLVQTEMLTIVDSNAGERTLSGVVTIANANSKQAAFIFEVNNTGGTATAEFDNQVLTYSPDTITAFQEN